jgi:hypothetical protein
MMQPKNLVMVVAMVAVVGLGSAPVGAQSADPEAQALISDPLENYTLDAMIPARSAEDSAGYLAVAKSWVEASDRYEQSAKKARELVKTRLSVKESEINTLEARVKEAKKSGDPAEADRMKAEIKVQKDQADALKKIQAYGGEWDDLANAMENSGKAWIAMLEAEQEVANLRSQAAKRAKKSDDPLTAGAPSPEDFKAHKKYADAVNKFGNALENHGRALKQLSGNASKVMSDWEKRSLSK